FEYVLISGVNNTQKDAQELIKHLSHIPSKLNIIPFNEIDSKFQRPNEQDILTFMSYFKGVSFAVTLRNSGGKGIQAACGQLYHEAFLL
ncbi:MAG: 23S rRNA (adenine(2503)-C(2))-methyltransferase RlmN, partial [Candidatus Marinimicrobia bacterium]|nr:23S rRNA (adenine(2503)-C(2))-methyltransferase RlmN [Candidatus Neomarinimicrobiota bacterium]